MEIGKCSIKFSLALKWKWFNPDRFDQSCSVINYLKAYGNGVWIAKTESKTECNDAAPIVASRKRVIILIWMKRNGCHIEIIMMPVRYRCDALLFQLTTNDCASCAMLPTEDNRLNEISVLDTIQCDSTLEFSELYNGCLIVYCVDCITVKIHSLRGKRDQSACNKLKVSHLS